ncbi:MAG: LPS export ABC transporter permease LptF [Alphaproteobacteria bacterium]
MNSINRYILRQLIIATLFVALVLTALVTLVRSLRLVDFVVSRGLPPSALLELTALLLPTFFAIILPIALFTAVLFVYNKLVTDSELVVMRAAGLSHLGLAKPAILLTAVVTGTTYFLYLYLLPVSYGTFKNLETSFRHNFGSVMLQEGRFNTPVDGITVYVRAREPDGELLGIFIHDARDREKPITIMAERGAVMETENGRQVVMFDGNRQEVDSDTGRLLLLYFEQNSVDLSMIDETLRWRWREPEERFLGELLQPADTPHDQAYATNLIAEGHRRLSAPLNVLALVAIALASLLSGDFDRRGQMIRVLGAVGCAILLQSSSLGLANAAAKSLTLIPLLYAVPLAASITAVIALFRRRRRRGDTMSMAPAG